MCEASTALCDMVPQTVCPAFAEDCKHRRNHTLLPEFMNLHVLKRAVTASSKFSGPLLSAALPAHHHDLSDAQTCRVLLHALHFCTPYTMGEFGGLQKCVVCLSLLALLCHGTRASHELAAHARVRMAECCSWCRDATRHLHMSSAGMHSLHGLLHPGCGACAAHEGSSLLRARTRHAAASLPAQRERQPTGQQAPGSSCRTPQPEHAAGLGAMCAAVMKAMRL